MIQCNFPCCSSTMPTLMGMTCPDNTVYPLNLSYSPVMLCLCGKALKHCIDSVTCLISSKSCHAEFSLSQGWDTAGLGWGRPAKSKTPLSSAAGWGWRMCSLVQIWACTSQQNLRLLLICFVLPLTRLTLQRPLRPPSKPKTGMLYLEYFMGRPTLQLFCFW